MTLKFILLYRYSSETAQGEIRMKETQNVSLWSLLAGYKSVLKKMLSSREMLLIVAISVLFYISGIAITNYFSLYITKNLGVPEQYVALFPIGRSAVLLLFFLLLQSKFNRFRFRPVLLMGFGLFILSHVLLMFASEWGLFMIIGYTVLEAAAFAMVSPRKDSLTAQFVDRGDRARVMSVLYVCMLSLAAPFGALLGWFSSINRMLPFLFNVVVFLALGWIVQTSKTLEKFNG